MSPHALYLVVGEKLSDIGNPILGERIQVWENIFQLSANSKAAHKLGANNIRILAKFSFELILLYGFATELGADQSVCLYTFSRACHIKIWKENFDAMCRVL